MRTSSWTLLLGLLMAGAGVLALVHPFPASLTVAIFAGWSFVVLGALQLLSAFRGAAEGHRLWLVVLAVIMIWIGVVLLKNPLDGLMALTIVIVISLILSAAAKLFIGWALRGAGLGGWVMLSGAVTLLLCVMVMANLLPAAMILPGIFLGVELLSNGIALLFLWHTGKQA